ncbi:glycoside hydrolase family 16 protein [uncultured Algibacter sp.]|uniref:glycoside hydrolase family 16 protein n=1 Tax=uncultured Algibacter sp. TaxID=298659 RepID=UPI002613EA18|nr:glycoside hydrolase family 16 protein [uncultured Algibacter sp.]
MKNKFLNTDIKSILHSVFCVSLIVLIVSCNPDETQTVTNFDKPTLSEEFDGTELNTNLWTYEIGDGSDQGIPGWGNNEQQYYTNRTENVLVEDGVLKIIARQESFEGSSYTSGRIITKGRFEQKYGRFEARIKLPWGTGMWPAFWMVGDDSNGDIWPEIGEIDIMENRGQEPTLISASVHGPGYCGNQVICESGAITKEYELTNDRFDTDFHIFGVEWGPNYINYYVDDVLYNQITPEDLEEEDIDESNWVFNDRKFYIILNVAVGGNFAGNADPNIPYPQIMEVDYVRAYQ